MAKSNFLFGRVKTRKHLNSARKGTVSCYAFKTRRTTQLRYSDPIKFPFRPHPGSRVRYRIKVTLKPGVCLPVP